MSQADVEQKAALALHLQEQDDALLCAFGPNYFDGVRKGAACGAVFTACLSRLTYINLREDFKEHEASIPKHMRRGAWTVSRGFKTRPFFTLGCISLALTSLMKSVKFVLANYRYQEFVADDIGFQLLEEMYANSPMGREEIGKLLDDAFKNLNSITVLTPNNNVKSHDPMQTSLTNKLIQKASPRAEQRPPSFWDGVAVGLMGSVMDSYLPSKPLYCYYGMRCGMRM